MGAQMLYFIPCNGRHSIDTSAVKIAAKSIFRLSSLSGDMKREAKSISKHNTIRTLLQAFLRMVYHSCQDLLLEVLSVPGVSSQIAGMLSSGDLKIIVGALQLSELLLQKMPDEFGVHFREAIQ